VMRSALPEEIEEICQHNLISDSTLTLLHIQRCLEDMMQEMGISVADASTSGVTSVLIRLWFTAPELGHPLIDDIHDRPLHPLVGPFLRGYLSRYEDMDDENDEIRYLYTAYATPECWPAQCWRIVKPYLLWTTTTLARPS